MTVTTFGLYHFVISLEYRLLRHNIDIDIKKRSNNRVLISTFTGELNFITFTRNFKMKIFLYSHYLCKNLSVTTLIYAPKSIKR